MKMFDLWLVSGINKFYYRYINAYYKIKPIGYVLISACGLDSTHPSLKGIIVIREYLNSINFNFEPENPTLVVLTKLTAFIANVACIFIKGKNYQGF